MKVSQLFSACAFSWMATTALASANAADSGVSPPTSQRRLTEHQQQLALSSDPASPSPSPTTRALATVTTSSPSPTPATIRVLAETTTATPKPAATKQKVCRQYLTTQCSDSRPVCIKDYRDRLVQVLALQEAQDAYIATRGLEKDALGIYVDYREQQDKLTLDSSPQATEWLFLSGIQLNGKLDYDFPEDEAATESEDEGASQLKSVILAGEKVESIEKVNFPDQVTTIHPLQTATKMRVIAAAAAIFLALSVFSVVFVEGQARDANEPTAAATIASRRGDPTGDDRAKKNQQLLSILNLHGDAGELETLPALRCSRRDHRQLRRPESLISWLFESARGYWNFKQESKRDKQENKENKESNNKNDKND